MDAIVVGVTGKGENTAALRFAARHAALLQRGVTLVHAVPTMLPPPPPPSVLMADSEWEHVAHRILADVEEEFCSLAHDTVPVKTRAVHGHPGSALAALSQETEMIVVQHQDMSRLYRIATGSTVAFLAAHAHCPVVSVPALAADRSERAVVTAGVHEDGGPVEVLEAAFAQANLYRASLRVVHALRLAAAYDDVLLQGDGWRQSAHAAIAAAVEPLAVRFPAVAVDIEVRHDWPTDVLAARSRESDLLVMGRHGRLGPLPARLGSVSRSAVAHAECPVMIVPIR